MAHSKKRRFGVAVVVLLVFGAGTAVGVSMNSMTFNPLEPGKGAIPDSSLVIDSESLSYSGLDATKATLQVNNTDSVNHGGDVHLSLVDSSGSTVTSASNTSLTFKNNTVKSVVVDFSDTNVSSFDSVEVRIEETS